MSCRCIPGLIVIAFVLTIAPRAAPGQSCTAQWSAPFPAGDLDGVVCAMAVYDDGSGPALFVGGTFTYARGLQVNKIAKWNGTAWSALGGGQYAGVPTGSGVYALAVFNDGTGSALYVGGYFPSVSYGLTVNNIAKWDGSAWSRLASGSDPPGVIGGVVWSLATWVNGVDPNDPNNPSDPNSPALYVGGTFLHAGGAANVNRIARWGKVGSSFTWRGLGGGMDNGVYALAVFDDDDTGPNAPALYAAGGFFVAGETGARRIAKWSKVGQGMVWSSLPGAIEDGVNNTAWALAVFDDDGGGANLPALYVAGRFTTAGGLPAKRVARWGRSGASMAWSALGTGITDEEPLALQVFDDDASGPHATALYVGGSFTQAGGGTVNGIAQWNGQSWSALGAGVVGTVRALAVFDDDGGGSNPPALFVGGELTKAGGLDVGQLAKWSCSTGLERPGDLNCDGVVDYADINPFVLLLNDPVAYANAYPGCPASNGDCNDDGLVNFADINPFVALLDG